MARQPIRILVKLGKPKQYNVYIWRESEGRWIDYTPNVGRIEIESAKNQLASIKLKLFGIITEQQKVDVSKGNFVAVTCNQRLVSKFVMEQPRYHTDRVVDVVGYESNGNNNMQLRRALTGEKEYTNATVRDIIEELCGEVITIDDEDEGGNRKVSVSFKNEPLTKAISRICELSDNIWWIEHKDVYLGSLGEDVLHIKPADEKFSDTTKYQFFTHGANINALNVSYELESESLVNDVVVQCDIKTPSGLKTISTEIFHATTKRTTLSRDLDTYLENDLEPDDTTITVKDSSVIPSIPYVIQVGEEKMQVIGIDGNELTVTRGYGGTTSGFHYAGEGVCCLGTDGNNAELYVDLASNLGNATQIYVGSELMSVISIDTSNNKLICSRENPYAHLRDTPVYTYSDDGGTYTKTMPEPGSSIYEYGLKSRKVIDRLATSKHDLDIRANAIIEEKKDGVEKIVVDVVDPMQYLGRIEVGDCAEITDAQSGLNGDKRNIIGYKFRYTDKGIALSILFTDEEFVFATELKESVDEDISKVSGHTAETFEDNFEATSSTLSIKKDVVLNNKNLRVGSGSIDLYSEDTKSGSIYGTEEGVVVKNMEVKDSEVTPINANTNLGSSDNYWNEVHYSTLVAHSPKKGIIPKGGLLDLLKEIDLGDKSTLPDFLRYGKEGTLMNEAVYFLFEAVKEINEKLEKIEKTLREREKPPSLNEGSVKEKNTSPEDTPSD